MMEVSFNWRGLIIGDTITLERNMDTFISEHFCKTKTLAKELEDTLLSTKLVTYDSKKQVFCFIMKKHHPDWCKKFPDINKELQTIGEQRNIFAHYMLDTRPIGVKEFASNKKLGFVEIKNDVKPVYYTQEQLVGKHALIKKYIKALMDLNTK
jgi:hypothetical protein